MVLDRKSSQEYPVNAGFPQVSILAPTLFLLYINDLPDNVISNIAIFAALSLLMALLFILSVTRHLIYGNNLNWLLNLNDDGSIDVKMDGSALEEKSSFEMLGLTFYSKLDWGSYIISIGKTGRKSEL